MEHSSASEEPEHWAATVLGFVFCSQADLHNPDVSTHALNRLIPSHAKETGPIVAQILKLLG